MTLVSIVIPTLLRERSLARALASACRQRTAEGVSIEIIVIDNSLGASARDTAADAAAWGWPVHYHSEPNPGVATARNAGVRAARGEWIAFLDDDEEAADGWIATMLGIADSTGAGAVFGPVAAQAEGGSEIGQLGVYFSRQIERPDGADISDLAAYLGTNNSMFAREWLAGEPFDLTLNETGGEDSLLLQRIVLAGGRLAFAANAGVIEWAPQTRLNWGYIRKRKFLSGQIRVFVQQMLGPAHWPRIPFWMAVGLAQFICAGSAALILRRFAPDRAERLAATASGGLGKVLWGPRFRPALYGSGLVS